MASSTEIQEIKDKLNIVDFVGEYLKLLPAGVGVYKASCPFHNEKTPSMIVSPVRNNFHCFGCGAGGDIFEFLMKIENIPFTEALKILAQKAGVTLSRQNPEVQDKKNRLYDLCELVAKYWHQVLLQSQRAEVARSYLSGRQVSDEVIVDFNIGYAIEDWNNLFDFLIKKGFTPDEIMRAGFAIKKDRGGGYYDRFRNRIMFPISDHNGRVCGFTGRTLSKDEPAKYVNTPQTEIYNKSAIVFALHQAKNEIRKSDAVVVVEGQMDAVTCHQFGFKNTVASSGTALTREQLQLLKRFTNNIFFALDADDAGKKATDRGNEILTDIAKEGRVVVGIDRFGRTSNFINPALSSNLNLKIISIPNGKDPDECLKNNPDDWRLAVQNALPAMEYFWQTSAEGQNINDPQVKKQLAKFLGEKIARIDDPIEKDHWTHEVANRLGVREEAVRELISRFTAVLKGSAEAIQASQKPATVEEPQKAVIGPDLQRFREILAIIWAFPIFLPKLPEILDPAVLDVDFAVTLYKDLILFYTKNNELFTVSVSERNEQNIFDQFYSLVNTSAANREAIRLLEQSYLLTQKDFLGMEAREAKIELDNLIRLLKGNYLSREIVRLRSAVESAERAGDEASVLRLMSELNELIKIKSAI